MKDSGGCIKLVSAQDSNLLVLSYWIFIVQVMFLHTDQDQVKL